jgi:hypothetical protein
MYLFTLLSISVKREQELMAERVKGGLGRGMPSLRNMLRSPRKAATLRRMTSGLPWKVYKEKLCQLSGLPWMHKGELCQLSLNNKNPLLNPSLRQKILRTSGRMK